MIRLMFMFIFFVCHGVLLLDNLSAQSYRSLVNGGNDLYSEKKYDDAAVEYEKSLKKNPERTEGYFNLGNTKFRKGDYKSAMEDYKKGIMKVRDKSQAAQSLYNIGNSFLDAAEKASQNPAANQMGEQANQAKMEGYKQAVEAYKQSLKLDPKDEDTRYNLAYAQKKLLQLQQQQQNQKDNKQNKDQKQNKDDKNKQDQKKNDQDNKDDKKQQQQQQNQQEKGKESEADKTKQQPQQQKENKMSKEQAERILDALKNDEKDLQKKLKKKANVRIQVDKDW